MKFIEEPRVYLVAKTALDAGGLSAYLRDIGSPEWAPDPEVSDAENLIEAAGRMCYRSWQPYDPDKREATNPNVGRVRQGNKRYIGHVLEAAHGSVLEHAQMTFICRSVSRVFTHELVRHRAGMAYSQESLRYVRLDELSFWLPDRFRSNAAAQAKVRDALDFLEGIQKELAELFAIDDTRDFQRKKELTSAFRRLAPTGLATSIMVTGTLRAWRHIIALRTSPAAEEEIRLVLGQIARICLREFPHVFQDMEYHEQSGEWTFAHPKV
jgi:thymidylate synthase (FAD)